MHETPDDLERLQRVLDDSRARAGAHLKGIFENAWWRALSALDLSELLTGVRHLAVATVTSAGEPRVGPVDGLFYRARFGFSVPGNSYRLRHLRERPAISATHFEGDDLSITVHGHAELVGEGDGEFAELDRYWTELYGESPTAWAEDITFVRIEPQRMFAYTKGDRSRPPA